MPEVVMRAPRFERILTSGSDKASKAVKLTFLATDGKKYSIELSVECAALTLAAIAAHCGEILSTLSAKDQPSVQPIIGKSVQAAMRDNGALALILTLEGGAELPLEFPRQDIPGLAEQFAELASLADRHSRH